MMEMYSFCVWTGIIGVVYYVGLLIYPFVKRQLAL